MTYVATNSFLPSSGARPGVPQLVIFMTDGQSQGGGPGAKVLHDAGVTVLSLGIGSGIVMSQLEVIASDPRLVFGVDSFDNLNTVTDTIHNVISAC